MATVRKMTVSAVAGAALLMGCATMASAEPQDGDSTRYERSHVQPDYSENLRPNYKYSYRDRQDRRDRAYDWRYRGNPDDPYGRDSRGVTDPATQQHLDDITHGIVPPDDPSQDIGQYSR